MSHFALDPLRPPRRVACPPVIRAYRLRFYPSPRQRRRLAREFGAARWVWNYALKEKKRAWEERKESLSTLELSRSITRLKRTDRPWLAETASTVLTQSLRDLDRAYANFFARRARYPRWKKKHAPQSVRFQLDPRQKRTWVSGERLVLPRLGSLKLVWSRVPQERPLMVTVRRDAVNRYFVSFGVEETMEPLPTAVAAVGVDVGLKSTVTLSDGKSSPTPALDPPA